MNSGNPLPNLDKILKDDDESDFVQSGGSNLAAIFGISVKGQDAQPSTKLQVQKKAISMRTPLQAESTNKIEIIIAKAVHAFKLQNGSYVSAGRLGMALTGNISTRIYEIILYKTKQEHVSVVRITHDFLYTVQANNYSSYYDNKKENWSILFENNDVCTEFAREIGLARYFSKDSKMETALYQDLSPNNKNAVAKEGDNINIKYFIVTTITQPFKGNSMALQTMTVEISTDDNWERILIGASKGLKRILFLPPNRQISLGPGFPKEKDVMLEIEIIDIRVPEEIPPLQKIGSGKASILSRMAKMGQSMLPKMSTPITTDSEDTEDDVIHHPKSPRHKKVESLESLSQKKNVLETTEDVPRNVHKVFRPKNETHETNSFSPKPLVSASTFTPQWSPTQIQSNYVTLDGQMYSLQPQSVAPTVPTVIDPGINILLSETRMSNTELRMGMSKIADNVQKLLDKFHVLELQNAATPSSEKVAMDTTLKMLLAINTTQAAMKDVDLQKQTDVANNMPNDNLSELNEMKHNIAVLEKQIKESEETLTNNAVCIKDLQSQNGSLSQSNEQLCKQVRELETLLKDANDALKKVKEDLDEAKKLNNEYEKQNTTMEDKVSKLQVECNNLKQTASSSDEKDNDNKNKEIKQIMNKTYQTLLDKFEGDSYSTEYIRTTIASTIKNITLHVLYENAERNNMQSKLVEATETDFNNIDSELCGTPIANRSHSELLEEPEVSMSPVSTVPVIRDQPPPIPPIDHDIDSDSMHY